MIVYESREKDGYSVVKEFVELEENADLLIDDYYEGFPVMEILDNVFKRKSIRSIRLPFSLHKIGKEAFYGCNNLETIYIDGYNPQIGVAIFPQGLHSVGESGFEGTQLLKDVIFTSTMILINRYAFKNSGIESIAFRNEEVVKLGEGAFCDCKKLKFVSYSDIGIEELPNHCFSNCESLEKIIANHLNGIGAGCFYGCGNLESIPIHAPLKIVGEEALYGCKLNVCGFFRRPVDVINAFGDDFLVNELKKKYTNQLHFLRRNEHLDNFIARAQDVAKEVLREVHFFQRSTTDEETVLTKCVQVAAGEDAYDEYYYEEFIIYDKNEIFKYEPQSDLDLITYDFDCPEILPPFISFDKYIQKNDIDQILLFKRTGPKELELSWDNPDHIKIILNSTLVGDAADHPEHIGIEILNRLIINKLKAQYWFPISKETSENNESPLSLNEKKALIYNCIQRYHQQQEAFLWVMAELFNGYLNREYGKCNSITNRSFFNPHANQTKIQQD